MLKMLEEEFTFAQTLMIPVILVSYFHESEHMTDILIPNWNSFA